MDIQGFELNGVLIKTPRALEVITRIEKQSVKLLSGKTKSRIVRTYREAILSYSMLEQDKATTILNETLKRALEQKSTTVILKYLDEQGVMSTMEAEWSDFAFRSVSESIMNSRWAELDDIVFTEI